MSDEQAVAWLRAQIEGDNTAAKAVFEAAALFPAAPQRSSALGHQVFDGSGIVVTHDRTVVLPSDVARHIALHDPQDVVADCEAKLAILDADDTQYWTLTVLARGYRHRVGWADHWEKA